MRIARLDDRGHLIGARDVKSPKPDDIDCGDLPADGSYKWDAANRTFVPLGFGFGKVTMPKVDRDRAVYLLIKALTEGNPIPQECREWCDWYEQHNERKDG